MPVLTRSLSGQKQTQKVSFDPAMNGAGNAARPTPHAAPTVTGSRDRETDPLTIDPELTRPATSRSEKGACRLFRELGGFEIDIEVFLQFVMDRNFSMRCWT